MIPKKKAKILSTGTVQKIVDREMPGFRVVELAPEPAAARDSIVEKASRSLPSLVKMRQISRPTEADAEAVEAPAESEAELWGNSSQFALVEPKGPATGNDTMARRRRTVIVSHGKIITEQG
ncbi:MAG TPA: hypothetical protein VLE27_00950 [Thermoanaerobaculia bacterium]|nr:hypothetical protein [Thermoanaerobaculia bacterium]